MDTDYYSSPALLGVRIWLSGAVPPEATQVQRQSIITFVKQFAAAVFRSGGHILHGSHPSFTPTLLEEAAKYVDKGGRKDCLTLAVSKYWSKDASQVPVQDWRDRCMVYETPEATGENARDDSLKLLREWMSARCDAFVAVGGMWWKDIAGRAGVPLEAGLGFERGLPCFLLGGLGGAAHDFVRDHPALIKSLKNGFDEATNQTIATQENVDDLVHRICEQLARLPLVHGRVSEGISFRILALDGGGIKGAFTASVLATLEERLCAPLGSQFDLIAGTSTGGILAIGLGMGLSPADMLRFYRERGATIFPTMRFHRRWKSEIRNLFKPKHSQELLLQELKKAYFPGNTNKALGDSICRLVIPAYDAVSGVCHIFRTPHHPLLIADRSTNAAEVALATAAAPTYFSAAKVQNMISNAPYFDGGVWANCPAMAAIIEAVCYLNVPLDRIDVLSIGTTEEPFTVKAMAKAGVARWGKSLIDLLLNAQVDSVVRHAQQLVGEPRFLRINTMTNPGMYTLDNAEEIENLISLGNKRASDPAVLYQVKSRFLNGIDAMNWKIP
jgi:patatin-like phospholipase/acyl hydrolase